MQTAIAAIQSGVPVLKTSKLYRVPSTTIRNKIAGRSPYPSGPVGPQAVLGDEEKDLEDWILAVARMGFPINKEQLLDSVKKIVDESKIETPFQNGRPGRKWYDSFMKRHPKISQKKAEYLNNARANITEEKGQKMV